MRTAMHTAIEHARRLARWCGHLWAHQDYDEATRGLTEPLAIMRAVDKATYSYAAEFENDLSLPAGILCPAVDNRGCYVHESARKRISWRIEPDPPLNVNAATTVEISSGSRSLWGTEPGCVIRLVVDRRSHAGYINTSITVCENPRADWAGLATEAAEALGVADHPMIAEEIETLRKIVADERIAEEVRRSAPSLYPPISAPIVTEPEAPEYAHYFEHRTLTLADLPLMDDESKRAMLEALQD